MSLGKVITWQMSEEERLAYIAKHPIIQTQQPSEAKFNTDAINFKAIREKRIEAMKGKRIMDSVDTDKLHKMFMSGKRFSDIAKALNISTDNINTYISQRRKIEPEKWPYRK